MNIKKLFVGCAVVALMLGAIVVPAQAALSPVQVNAIINLLTSFGVDSTTLANVRAVLLGTTTPPIPPSITVTSPNGGEVWRVGETYEFKWRARGEDRISINLDNLDNGYRYGTFDAPNGISANLGKIEWIVREVNLPPGRYKASIVGFNGGVDSSDFYFTIVPATSQPSWPVPWDSDNSPNYSYIKNSISYPITRAKYPDLFTRGWGTGIYVGSDPDVHLIFNDDGTTSRTNNPYSTYHDHCVGDQLNEAFVQGNLLSALGVSAPAGYVCRNGRFVEIPSPSITVLSPNGGETYKIGSDIIIKWWDNNDAGNRNILITDLTHNSPGAEFMIQYNEFVRSSGIDGTYSKLWKINNIPTGKYKIQVCKSGTNECDFSDNYFNIISPTQPSIPSITVLSPNGGESYKIGDLMAVNWRAENMDNADNVSISLEKDGKSCWLGTLSLLNDRHLFSLSSNDGHNCAIVPGDSYRVSLQASSGSVVNGFLAKDSSDGYFTIRE